MNPGNHFQWFDVDESIDLDLIIDVEENSLSFLDSDTEETDDESDDLLPNNEPNRSQDAGKTGNNDQDNGTSSNQQHDGRGNGHRPKRIKMGYNRLACRATVNTRLSRARINQLPEELIVKIFRDLMVQEFEDFNFGTMLELMRVCRRWKTLIKTNPTIWSTLSMQVDDGFPVNELYHFVRSKERLRFIKKLTYSSHYGEQYTPDKLLDVASNQLVSECSNLTYFSFETYHAHSDPMNYLQKFLDNNKSKLSGLDLHGYIVEFIEPYLPLRTIDSRSLQKFLERSSKSLAFFRIRNIELTDGGVAYEKIPFPRMRTLCIQGRSSLVVDELVRNSPIVEKLCLRDYSLATSGSWDCKGLPLLRKLVMDKVTCENPLASFGRLVRSSPQLVSIDLNECSIPPAAINLAKSRVLESLKVSNSAPIVSEDMLPEWAKCGLKLDQWRNSIRGIDLGGWEDWILQECLDAICEKLFPRLTHVYIRVPMTYERYLTMLVKNPQLFEVLTKTIIGIPENIQKCLTSIGKLKVHKEFYKYYPSPGNNDIMSGRVKV